MRFNLSIKLGNDSTENPIDVARLLEKVASKLRPMGTDPFHLAEGDKILNLNGNDVGHWYLTDK